jgi:hypothetical protein
VDIADPRKTYTTAHDHEGTLIVHFTNSVFLSGDTHPDDLYMTLDAALEPFSEHDEDNVEMHWDWWVVGGRWGGYWVLKEYALDGPLKTQDSAFGPSDRANTERRTDCARLGDLEPESLMAPYSWLDLDGVWHTRWLGPEHPRARKLPDGKPDYESWEVPSAEFEAEYLAALANSSPTMWMVLIDYHS